MIKTSLSFILNLPLLKVSQDILCKYDYTCYMGQASAPHCFYCRIMTKTSHHVFNSFSAFVHKAYNSPHGDVAIIAAML